MIDRYSRPEMAAIWSEERKFSDWLRIELLATGARVELGEVPRGDFEEIEQRATFDPERIRDLEKKTRHDVAAFLDNVAEVVGPAARHLHYGMTSSDVIDTGLALALRDSADLLIKGLDALVTVVVRLARDHANTVMVARTHGIHAEPTTFGLKAAGWAFELDRARRRLQHAKATVSVGQISGVVGTYSQLSPRVEEFVCRQLGLEPDPISTQVISRDRHAEFASALAVVAGSLERITVEIRHLARTEVREVEEPFEEGEQKGSSAMPHKRNPWRSERISGLARLVRGYSQVAMENMVLWHERDISNSSAERVALPDACLVLDFMIAETTDLLDNLIVHPEHMTTNFDRSFGLVFSQSVLHALIDAGMGRDEAYRIVQESAMNAWRSGTHLRELLSNSAVVTKVLSPEKIEGCFDKSRYLEHAEEMIERLDSLRSSRGDDGRPD